MMMVRVSIDDRRVRRRLRGMAQRSVDLRPAWRVVHGVMIRSYGEQFQRSGDPNRWADLSAVTRARRRGDGSRAKPLLDTGVLRRTWMGGPMSIKDVKPLYLDTGSRLEYAGFHQKGGRGWGRTRVRARPLVVRDQDLNRAAGIIARHVVGK